MDAMPGQPAGRALTRLGRHSSTPRMQAPKISAVFSLEKYNMRARRLRWAACWAGMRKAAENGDNPFPAQPAPFRRRWQGCYLAGADRGRQMVATGLRVGVAGAGHFGRYHALKLAARAARHAERHFRPRCRRAPQTVAAEAGARPLRLARAAGGQRRGGDRGPGRSAFRARPPRRCAPASTCWWKSRSRRRWTQAEELGRLAAAQRRGAAGRPSATLLGRAQGDQRAHAPAALYRVRAHRPVQAARHRRVGHPRPDDPRPRSGAGAGGQPDRERGRGGRAGGERRTRISPMPACASRTAAWPPSRPAASR